MGVIIEWIKNNWVELVATLWIIEQAMRAISALTPWQFDNNITAWLSKILKSFFPQRKP